MIQVTGMFQSSIPVDLATPPTENYPASNHFTAVGQW